MKKISKISKVIGVFLISFSCLIVMNNEKIFAGYFSVSTNVSSVSSGGAFVTSVSLSGNGSGMVYFSGNNATVSASSMYCDTTCSVNAVAGSSGKASVTVTMGKPNSPNEVTDCLDGTIIAGEKTVSVSIANKPPSSGGGGTTYVPPKVNTDPDKRSADNNLAGLSVSQGKLTPDFNSEVTNYRVEAGANLKEINIEAKATDAKASVSGTGKKELKVGENSFDVICTAENTVTKTYNIIVYVDEKPLVYTKYENKELGVVRNLTGLSIPTGFSATKIKMNKKEIDAWKNEAGTTLVYLMDKKGNKNFYLYDMKKGVTSIYVPVTLAGHNLAIIDIPESTKDRNGMKFVENILVDNHKIIGWTYDDVNKKDFSLHLFMNEKGEKVYYQYDNKENILQRYIETKENASNVFGDVITYVSIGLAGLFAIGFSVLMIKNTRLKKSLMRKSRSLYEPEVIKGQDLNDMHS
ncbi:MAG: hypothetical protein RSB19_04030 [Erysipelotrichaceae bacterium]